MIADIRAKLYQRLGGALLIAVSLAATPAASSAAAAYDFSSWHLPLPAGEWIISRGPCGSPAPFDHPCGYYEDDCAIDLVAPTGDITDTPVLALQAGTVTFVGRRADAGITVMLEHADGRVSALMHLSKAVVSLGQTVGQGEVVGYVGSTGTARAHLHFHIQPNTVERKCLWPNGLDEIDFRQSRAISHNLAWDQVVLVDPPAAALDRMPPVKVSRPRSLVRLPVVLALGQSVQVPVVLTGPLSRTSTLHDAVAGSGVAPSLVASLTADGPLFRIPIDASGSAGLNVWPIYADAGRIDEVFRLAYTVAEPVDPRPAQGVVLVNPQFVSPAGYSQHRQPPRLCWRVPDVARQGALQFRVRIVGTASADSGWIHEACWQTPDLPKGTYFWKVFVLDGQGQMNRTNQRPFAFMVR